MAPWQRVDLFADPDGTRPHNYHQVKTDHFGSARLCGRWAAAFPLTIKNSSQRNRIFVNPHSIPAAPFRLNFEP
jgi:hypothetical protein